MSSWVIITGASSGIGAETAKHFSEKGVSCILLGRNQERLEKVSEQISYESLSYCVDLLSPESIASFCSSIQEKQIAGIVHCAGQVERVSFDHSTQKTFEEHMQVHVYSTVQINQAVKPLFTKDAFITYISSTLALKPIPETSAYSAAKAAQNSLVKSLAIEWAPNVRVNGLCLGIVDTPIQSFTEEQRKFAGDLCLLKRVGQPQEVAEMIYHISYSKWMTGSLVTLDGGIQLT